MVEASKQQCLCSPPWAHSYLYSESYCPRGLWESRGRSRIRSHKETAVLFSTIPFRARLRKFSLCPPLILKALFFFLSDGTTLSPLRPWTTFKNKSLLISLMFFFFLKWEKAWSLEQKVLVAILGVWRKIGMVHSFTENWNGWYYRNKTVDSSSKLALNTEAMIISYLVPRVWSLSRKRQ